jgi:hypothetical protein
VMGDQRDFMQAATEILLVKFSLDA